MHLKDDIKESGLRENCTIRLIERTEAGDCRPLSTLQFPLEMKDRTILNLGKQGGVGIPPNRRKHRGIDQKMATYEEIGWKPKGT